jgi:hypothetical protein
MQNSSKRATAMAVIFSFAIFGSSHTVLGADDVGSNAQQLSVETAQLGTLPAQELANGQCGLFLWTNASEPRLVFASLNDGNARMIINGTNLDLARNAAEGQEYYGQFELQSYYGPEMSVTLNMVIEQRSTIVDGAVIPSATLRVTEPNGWETVIPVGGLIGCGAV